MNVQEVMSPTSIIGNAAIASVDSVSGTKGFFSKSKLPLQQWLLMLYLWAREYQVSDAAEEAEISSRVVIDIYQWLREVCTAKLLQITWVVQVWSFILMNLCSGTNPR